MDCASISLPLHAIFLASSQVGAPSTVPSNGESANSGWTSQPIQVLKGHNDRVYCANFHPTQPVVATASADFSIKLFAPHQAVDSAVWAHE